MKKISILLSCFRADDLINEYIEALLQSQITSIATLVVIDFPFSHRDPHHVELMLRRYPDLLLIKRERNISLYDAWNQAIGMSRTDYVSNLNLDDRVVPEYYTLATKSLDAHKADVFSSQAIMTSTIGEWFPSNELHQHILSERFGDSSILQYDIQDMVFTSGGRVQKLNVPHCAPVWRRLLHSELGWFDSQAYDFCADFEFWLRVAAARKKMILHKDPLTLFYCGRGTASDRLMHAEAENVLKLWSHAWPPHNYRSSHLGERHDLLHFCLNMNVIFSSTAYYKHLGDLNKIDKKIVDVLNYSNKLPRIIKPSSNPLISVITPVFNAAGYIHNAVDSVFEQKIEDIELILVDDGSTDGSLTLAKQLASRDHRIRVLENKGIKGVSGARNTGLAHAIGKYIAFLDADDEYDDGALKARLTYFRTYPDVKLVHGPLRLVDEQNNDLGVRIAIPKDVTFADAHTNPAHLNTVMGVQELLRTFTFKEGMTNGEDWLYLAMVLRSGVVSHYVEDGGATYRAHRYSTVLQDMEKHENLIREVIDWVYSEVQGNRVAPKYRYGLSTPSVLEVRCRRDLSLFVWSLLSGDVSVCSRVLNQPGFLEFVNSLNKSSITAALRTPFVRKFLISFDRGRKLLTLNQKNIIYETCMALDLMVRAPFLFETILNVFCIDLMPITKTPQITMSTLPKKLNSDIALPPDYFQHKIVLVMGNGPSAKLINFKLLKLGHIASVGMNAAYRYWDRIDFRPNYYICMDTVVILSHAKRIAELVEEGRVIEFFLRDEFKELYPNLASHKRIFWFSQAIELGGLFAKSLITTGSWAIRWMMHKGMALIGTIGIDAKYVELLPEAKHLGQNSDLRLKICRTPKFNPNYFFSDYQQEGDRYNIPNDPQYFKRKGGLVHVDALRKVAEDLNKCETSIRVVDCSPISEHGFFLKGSVNDFLAKKRLTLITSFRSAGEPVFIQNCVAILAENCANPFVQGVHVLLEGTIEELEQRINAKQLANLRSLTESGSLVTKLFADRLSYKQIFDYANTLGAGIVAIINSDILITKDTAQAIVLARLNNGSPIYTLTRGNRTEKGDFIQGMKFNPPRTELAPDNFACDEKNFFSYDCYVYNAPLNIPQSLNKVMIGSYGGDTAIAAIFKLAGFSLLNPCLLIKSIHLDEKQRAYDGKLGQADLTKNILAVAHELQNRYFNADNLASSLNKFGLLTRNIAWLGGSKTLDIWHSVYLCLGATKWEASGKPNVFSFMKISIRDGNLHSAAEPIFKLIEKVARGNVFVEWELTGFTKAKHISDLLVEHEEFKAIGVLLYHYQWQAMIHKDHVTEDARAVFNDLLILIKDVLLGKTMIDVGETAQKATLPAMPPKSTTTLLPAAAIPMSGARLGFRVESGPYFTPIAPNQWRYTHAEAEQKLWIAALDAPGLTEGRTFVSCLRVQSDTAMTVNVSLGRHLTRHGKTDYEGTTQRIKLAPGVAQHLKLYKRFDQAHAALKLQLDVIDLHGGGAAVLTIDNLGVNESLASIRERLGAENLDFCTANRLFREGDFAAALGIYLWLSQQRSLPMYADNAVMVAKRLGMHWVKSAADLTPLLG